MVPVADESWGKLADYVADIVNQRLRTNPPVPTPWLAPEDAAAYLRLTPRGLEDMRAKGTGPKYHKVNARVVRYNVKDLDAWLLSDGGEHG